MNLTPEKKKQFLMLGLLAVLGGVMYFNFFASSDEDDDLPTVSKKAASGTKAATGKGAQSSADKNALPVIDSPLELAGMTNKAQEPGSGRNIFIYPPPPTPTPTPPPTPVPTPPVIVNGVTPGGVIGKTGDFTMTVMCKNCPADSQAFINGREHQTTFVNETQLKVAVPAITIANPGTLPIQVRSISDPKMFSNNVQLNVTPPPAPPYKYLGLFVKNGVKTAVVKFDLDNELLNVREGTVLGGHWKIVSINDERILFEDTNIKVSTPIPFTGEGG